MNGDVGMVVGTSESVAASSIPSLKAWLRLLVPLHLCPLDRLLAKLLSPSELPIPFSKAAVSG